MTRRTFAAFGAASGLYAAPRPKADPGYWTARESLDALRHRRMTATELLNATWRRIDRYNSELNAIIVQFREQSLARARQADEALAKRQTWGPLHGLPVTIKEAFAYKGSPNTWGREEFKGLNSSRTAAAIERLESAGAIVIGKTNCPVGLADNQSFNSIYGTTNNPWDITRTPGGATGGGAAAVAAGFGSLSLGSDSGGSIRTPAHLCGVYGHKSTVNLVSVAGHQPGPWDGRTPVTCFDPNVAGPLARDARDLALAVGVLGGPNEEYRAAWNWRLPPSRQSRLKDFRIGYMTGGPGPLASDVARIYDDVLSALGRTGAKLESGWPAGIDYDSQWETTLYLARSKSNPGEEALKRYRRRLEDSPNDPLALPIAGPHSRWLLEVERLLEYRAAWREYFKSHDVFLLPVACTVAFPHDHSVPAWQRRIETPDGKWSSQDFGFWSVFASLTGLPATVAPAGRTRAGLPAGIQIVAPMWEDATSIEFAALLVDCIGGFVPPSRYAA